MQMLCLKESLDRRCLFISYTGLLWIILQASLSKGLLQDQYVGCFYDISQPNSDLSYDNALTIESCIAKCPTTYATIQNGNACRCREDYGLQLPDTSCNLTCSGNNNELCGGLIDQQIVYVVYTACPLGTYGSTCGQNCHCKRDAPCDRTTGNCPDGCYGDWSGSACNTVDWQYIGCYKDDKYDRAMVVFTGDDSNNTLERCSRLCAERNYSYAGLEWAIQCFCGDTYDRYGSLGETSCNMTCSGNSNAICGGPDALSVYAVCPVGNYGKSCAGRCNCLNGERCIYRNGSCTTSRCRPGWTGNSCSIRDCSQNNGECYINEICSNVALHFSTISTCRCLDGFQRDKRWENCTDVDECQQSANVCDQSSTTCSNTPGSYICVCKDGFISFNTISCSGKANSLTNITGEDVNSKTIVAAVVGFIIGIVLTVGIGVTVLIVHRRINRLTIPHQDNELKTTASTNEVKAFSSQVHDNGRTVASISKSGVETISQKQQLPDGGDRYESLKDIDNHGTVYTTLQ